MNCVYYLKNKKFNSEQELDDFLLEKDDLYSKYGDVVFSLNQNFIRTQEKLERAAKDSIAANKEYKEAKRKYLDGETIEEFKPPYVGVNKFLSGLVNKDGKLLFPEFREKEYWDRRFALWKEGEFTEEEKELLFAQGQPSKLTRQEDLDNARKTIEKKWELQAKVGDQIHAILRLFFTEAKSGIHKGEIYGKNVDFFKNQLLSKTIQQNPNEWGNIQGDVIDNAIELGTKLYNSVIEKFGENCKFYPEFTITSEIINPNQEDKQDIHKLRGDIDLLIVDSKGNAHVIDYKTSPKEYYGEYAEAKKLAFMYQIAVYGRMLEKYGIKKSANSELLIVPIKIKDFKFDGENVSYSGIEGLKQQFPWVSFKDTIEQNFRYQSNLDDFIPITEEVSPETSNLLTSVVELMKKTFPKHSWNRFSESDEEIKEELEAAGAFKPNSNNVYSYMIGNKLITADSDIELLQEVKEYKEKINAHTKSLTQNLIKNLKQAIENEDTSMVLPSIYKSNLQNIIDSKWLTHKLSQYCNKNWTVLDNDSLSIFGVILLKNTHTKQIDVIKLSSEKLDRMLHFGDKDSTKLSGLDIEEVSKSNSFMLDSTMGNVELMETMFVLNSINNISDLGDTIGKIEILNPHYGNGISASNKELLYSFNTLSKHNGLKNNKFKTQEIKLATQYDLAINEFNHIMKLADDANWVRGFQKYKNFESSLSIEDNNVDNLREIRLEKLLKLQKKLEEEFQELKSNTVEQIQLATQSRRLYNAVSLAIAELQNVNFKQQITDHDNWLNNLNVFKHGLSGNYYDNPGNLISELLNTTTNQATVAYQNVRASLSYSTAKIRKLIDAVKTDNNFGAWSQYTLNLTPNIYKKMIRQLPNGDIALVNVNDKSLSTSEREFLKFFLTTINKNRYGSIYTEEQLKQKMESDDIEYYRLPLAVGGVTSQISQENFMDVTKSRLKDYFSVSKTLDRMKDTLEGIDRVDDSSIQKKADLFEMGTIFDRGEGENRLEFIKQKGMGYFDLDLESLLLKHICQYSIKNEIDKVFPIMKAAMIHLTLQGFNRNKVFSNDLEFIENYITASIKNKPIEEEKIQKISTVSNKVKSIASFAALGFNPVQTMYQTIQHVWNDLRIILMKPDIMSKTGDSAFTFSNMKDSFISMYGDLFKDNSKPTKNSLLNEYYGLNDMDMNTISDRLKSDKYGLFNFQRYAFYFSSRPDYYSRGTLFGAQMRHDGTWDAHSVKDGKLVYDFKKDKRFFAFSSGNTKHPDYNKQKSLYYAIATQMVNENVKYDDGTEFKIDLDNPNLPRAYTVQQSEAYKNVADDIYGYYTHEKKSMFHSLWVGSMIMQFKTFWTGKKNQYLGRGGIKLRGEYQQYIENGEKYYYQIDEIGNILFDEPAKPESWMKENNMKMMAPVMQWKGQWQEGILLTFARLFNGGITNFKSNFINTFYNEDPMLRNVFRSNAKQLLFDLTFWAIHGILIVGMLSDWDKEEKKEAKKSNDAWSRFQYTSQYILSKSFSNSFLDFNITESLVSPTTTWTPMMLEWSGRTLGNIWNVLFGDKNAWNAIVNSTSTTRVFKPMLQESF